MSEWWSAQGLLSCFSATKVERLDYIGQIYFCSGQNYSQRLNQFRTECLEQLEHQEIKSLSAGNDLIKFRARKEISDFYIFFWGCIYCFNGWTHNGNVCISLWRHIYCVRCFYMFPVEQNILTDLTTRRSRVAWQHSAMRLTRNTLSPSPVASFDAGSRRSCRDASTDAWRHCRVLSSSTS